LQRKFKISASLRSACGRDHCRGIPAISSRRISDMRSTSRATFAADISSILDARLAPPKGMRRMICWHISVSFPELVRQIQPPSLSLTVLDNNGYYWIISDSIGHLWGLLRIGGLRMSGSAHTEDFLNFDEAVEFLRTTPSTLYKWLQADKIPAHKLGRQWRFVRRELEAHLAGHSGGQSGGQNWGSAAGP